MSENVNVCEYIESKCVHVEADCFDLEQIMESGQCFRIYKLSLQEQEKLCKSKGLENCESMAWYRVMSADKKVFVCQNGVHLIFFCSKEEYKQFWCHYFDLDFDYRSYEKAIDADDNYLKSAFAYGRGIRILNQDPWEMLITFIISQRKNIPAIRQAVESLSTTCGTCIDKENEFFAGVGEPWFDSVESVLSHAVFSVGGVKGIEFGSGFSAAGQRGSQFNDPLRMQAGRVVTATNHNGGINGGISNGMPVVFQCAVKPTPSIAQPQQTVDFLRGEDAELTIRGRHDPAIIRRICPVLDSVTALALCDLLAQRFGTDYFTKGVQA